MNSLNKALIVGLVALLGMGGLLFWKKKLGGHAPVVLTKEDMKMLAEGQSPQELSALAQSPEQRKAFAEFVKRILSIGAAAETAGLQNEPDVKQELDLQRTATLAQVYLKNQQKGNPQASLFNDIKPEDVEAYYQNKTNQARFDKFVAQLKEKNPAVVEQLTEERLKDLRQRYGQTFLAADKAVAAGLDKKRDTELQLQFQRARLLTQKYAEKNIVEKAKTLADDKAVDAYIAAHPELDESKMRAKAEGILQRVKAGEDFAKLAQEFSEDPGSKDKGGELGWFGKGQMVPAFEEAAFKLQPGQVSDVVKSDFGFHIIKVEERRINNGDAKDDKKKDPDAKKAHAAAQPPPGPEEMEMNGPPMQMPAKPKGPQEEVRASHILIKVGGERPPTGGPPQSPRDQAKAAVEEEKQKEIVDEIVKNSRVEVPEEFEVSPPEAPPGGLPPGMGGPPPGGGPQGPPPPGPAGKPKAVAPPPAKKK